MHRRSWGGKEALAEPNRKKILYLVGVRWFWAHTQEDTHRKSDTWRSMAQCSVLIPREKPIGKTTHRWPGVPKTRTRTQGETHIEEAALRAASTKGAAAFGGRPPLWILLYGSLPGYGFVSLGRPASDVSFCLWASPWTICPLSYGCPPGV